jgi:GT2 family glycosyltransferase
MKLSIVIVNWNSKQLIKECISSLIECAGDKLSTGEYEIIVIDNGSTDGSLEYLKSLQDKMKLIENYSNTGYAPACNQGMKIARGEYVLLLGSDTVLFKDTLGICIKFLDDNEEAGAVGCRLLNPDGTVQNSCKKFPTLKNAFFTYLSLDSLNANYDMKEFSYDKTVEVDQIATTFLMIRKKLLEQIGYFNDSYKMLYNDVDLCKRIKLAGAKIYFLHTASLVHHGSHSTRKAGFKLRKAMYGDIYRYYKNNFGFKAVFLYPILVLRLLIVSTIKG